MDNLKSLLKNSMVVELRRKGQFIVIGNYLIGANTGEGIGLNIYNDNLTRLNTKWSDDYDIMGIYDVQNLNQLIDEGCSTRIPLWEREEEEIDWNKVTIDTKILVGDNGDELIRRYFAKYVDGKVFAFSNGKTSFSADNIDCTSWKYARLYKEEDK